MSDTPANMGEKAIASHNSSEGAIASEKGNKDGPPVHPDLDAGPLQYTHETMNSAHLTDDERALHARADNVDGESPIHSPAP